MIKKLLYVLIGIVSFLPIASYAEVSLINVNSSGDIGNGGSNGVDVTPDGRYVLFSSQADNLVPNDTNGEQDVFIRDTVNNVNIRVSVNSSGDETNSYSSPITITPDGRYVVFQSYADNLVANDVNGQQDVFVRDVVNNITTIVSQNDSGDMSNNFSRANGISNDGRYVVFQSYADNLVVNDLNAQQDVFVRDVVNNTTILVNTNTAGDNGDDYSASGKITADGRYVVFISRASNLVANDLNANTDVFVRDLVSNTTVLVSQDDGGDIGNGSSSGDPSITPDGRYVLFSSQADNLVADDTNGAQDVFVRDMVNNTTTLISQDYSGNVGDDSSGSPSITDDGRYVLFSSYATNLGANDTNGDADVFVRDLVSNQTILVSQNDAGDIGNTYSDVRGSWISADGRYVIFYSDADNLVANDTNGDGDVFVRDVVSNTTTLISQNDVGDVGNSYSEPIALKGMNVLFYSDADNLVANDTNGDGDVFLFSIGGTPRPTITSPASGAYINTSNLLVTGSGTADATLYLTHESNTYQSIVDSNGNWSYAIPVVGEGQHTLGAYMILSGGVDSGSTITRIFYKDTIAPSQPIITTPIIGNSIRGTSEAGAIITIRIAGSGNMQTTADHLGQWSLHITPRPNGVYIIDAMQTDRAGNNSAWSNTVQFTRSSSVGVNVVSVNSNEILGNYNSEASSVSITSDGRYILFQSAADNLVPNDTNNEQDVFVRDTVDGVTIRVSVGASGQEAFGSSEVASITPDGRYVLFTSEANNLVANDQNSLPDVFVRDLVNNTTILISQNDVGDVGYQFYGASAVSITPDGRYVLFQSAADNLVPNDTNGTDSDAFDAFVRDVVNNTTVAASRNDAGDVGNRASVGMSISDDGRFVLFTSLGDNLVSNDTNGMPDIFLRDMVNNTTHLINQNDAGDMANLYSYLSDIEFGSMSSDGRYVVFMSEGDNLAANDTNAAQDVFVRDTINNTTLLVSQNNNGDIANGTMSALPRGMIMSSDGRYVVFASDADNLVANDTNNLPDLFLRDMVNNTTTLVLEYNSYDRFMNITPDGRYILYAVGDGGRPPLVNNVYVKDLVNNTTTLVSQNDANITGNNVSFIVDITPDGKYVVFNSDADNLVTNDINGSPDVFVRKMYDDPVSIPLPTVLSPISGSTHNTSTINIHGTGNAFYRINLDFSGSIYSGMVDSNGSWTITVNGLNNGAYALHARQDDWVGNTGGVVSVLFNIQLPVVTPSGGFGGGGTSAPTIPNNPGVIRPVDPRPEAPVVVPTVPTRPTTTVEIVPTTPNIAIKQAIVQTSNVAVGSTVAVKTVHNPALETEKKCYSPKEVIEITLGKKEVNKDLLVYQALLKSYDLTIFLDTDSYNPENGLKRYEAAKMFVNFAKHVLCRQATQEYTNTYNDIEYVDATLKPYIIQAYEYGILKGSRGEFRPLDIISKKEFIAALIRMFTNKNLDIYDKGNDWDLNYQVLFKEYGLDSIVGISENIDRYDMSKIMYKLYYNSTYQWTESGYALPYQIK